LLTRCIHQFTDCTTQIRDYQREGDNGDRDQQADTAVNRSSLAFSIMCMILTVLYGGFAALTFWWSKPILQEISADDLHEESSLQHNAYGVTGRSPSKHHFVVASNGAGYDGYIGERFDVRTSGFVGAPVGAVTGTDGTLA
jgi:hypothetical protein